MIRAAPEFVPSALHPLAACDSLLAYATAQ
jgi:hypothetical protein